MASLTRPTKPTDGAGVAATHTPAQAWLARGAILAAVAAVGVLIGFAGTKSLGLLAVGVAGAIVMVAGAYWFLVTHIFLRWLALAVSLLAPVVVVVYLVRSQLVLVVLVSLALAALSVAAGAAALASDQRNTAMRTYEVAPPLRPYLIMNPYSGGGKVAKFGLKARAEALGAEVALIEGPGKVDVAALARNALDEGADLLGVAGGDGTQALVAGIAAERGVPFLVISAGTRNHFALDLGLDREEPATCLDALADGVEVRIDLGVANGRTFVNNVSFGAYAEVVQSPAYRNDKTRTTLKVLPDLLTGRRGARLHLQAPGGELDGPQAVLVSNNPYGTTDLAGLGRRARLDQGLLGVAAVSVDNVRQAVGLLHRTHERGLNRFTGSEVVVYADTPQIPAAIDGEALTLAAPVRCGVERHVLRVRVPRHRPGVPQPRPAMDWVRLRQLAFSRSGHR
ncbi:MAG: putative rane protein [Frankiales bacterium]|nr:putative rane protein [Frankiales bacterium]